MKRWFLAVALVLGWTAPAGAANVDFTGSFLVTAVSAGRNGAWSIGDEMFARYAPSNLGTNGTSSRLSAFGRVFGCNDTLADGAFSVIPLRPRPAPLSGGNRPRARRHPSKKKP